MACKDFKSLKEENKTWDNLKLIFQKEYQDLKDEEKVQETPGYQSNNIKTITEEEYDKKYDDIDRDLDNVSLSVSSDSEGLRELIKSNETLIETNRKLVEENLRLKEMIKNVPKMDYGNYFWTHGYRLFKCHNSKTCPNKNKEHNDESTRENIMGGSVRNKKWTEIVNKFLHGGWININTKKYKNKMIITCLA